MLISLVQDTRSWPTFSTSTPVTTLMNYLPLRNKITKQSGVTHSALSRASRSHDTIEPMSSQTKRKSKKKKENLPDNHIFLFQFLSFHMLDINRGGFQRDPSLPSSFRFEFVLYYVYYGRGSFSFSLPVQFDSHTLFRNKLCREKILKK